MTTNYFSSRAVRRFQELLNVPQHLGRLLSSVARCSGSGRAFASGTSVLIFVVALVLTSGCATQSLHNAVAQNKPAKAIDLVRTAKNIEQRNAGGATPLHAAVEMNQPEVVRALLDAGANVNACMPAGETPIFFVWRHKNPEIMKLLIDKGANVNAVTTNGLPVLCVLFQGIDNEASFAKSEALGEALVAGGAALILGVHSPTNFPPSYAWGTFFLGKHADSMGDHSVAALHYQSASSLFNMLANAERARSDQLKEHAKGTFGRNLGRAIGAGILDGLIGGLTGVQVNTFTTVESKKAILRDADRATHFASLYERAGAECHQSLKGSGENASIDLAPAVSGLTIKADGTFK